MDFTSLTRLFFSSDAPWLPHATASIVMMYGGWAVVLGAAIYWFGSGQRAWVRWMVVLMTVALCLFPGPASPVYWLGLMFQAPSLMSVMLCLAYVFRSGRGVAPDRAWPMLVVTGMVLGWVLLLDMLAWWPVSFYAWGFSTAALALVCVVMVCFWLAWGNTGGGLQAFMLLATVGVLFVVTRLPSGNVWDALLDPCLWLVLLGIFLVRGYRWVRRCTISQRLPPATRA